ncbi:transposase [Pontibacter sp. 172403-2]|nr:transposase [Pontibacter sp. 172403-2]
MIRALKEHEGGRKAEDIYRELEVSRATFYRWKIRYGSMYISEAKRLKELEENARLKKMFADCSTARPGQSETANLASPACF